VRELMTGLRLMCLVALAWSSAPPCLAQAPDQAPAARAPVLGGPGAPIAAGPGQLRPGTQPRGPEQATGAPDTAQAGDIPTAWASLEPNAGAEWLQVDFDQAVTIAEVRIRESYNPGAVSKVVAILQDGKEHVLWEGLDPTVDAPSDFVVKAEGDVVSKSIKMYLDTTLKQGWNEIDAVELVGKDGKRQWASHASASSTYAVRTAQPKAFAVAGPGPIVEPRMPEPVGRTAYRTDVKVSPAGIPHQYVVEFKIAETAPDGTTKLFSPKITVTAGQEAEVKASEREDRDGVFCKALVKEHGDSVEALTTVTVKTGGIETMSSSQAMTVTK